MCSSRNNICDFKLKGSCTFANSCLYHTGVVLLVLVDCLKRAAVLRIKALSMSGNGSCGSGKLPLPSSKTAGECPLPGGCSEVRMSNMEVGILRLCLFFFCIRYSANFYCAEKCNIDQSFTACCTTFVGVSALQCNACMPHVLFARTVNDNSMDSVYGSQSLMCCACGTLAKTNALNGVLPGTTIMPSAVHVPRFCSA